MTVSPVMVVSGFAATLAAMSVATVVILRVQAQQDRLRRRIARTVGPHQRSGSGRAAAATAGVGLAITSGGVGPMLARLFGFDPALSEHYMLRWQVALTATLLVATALAKISSGLAGDTIWLGMPLFWIMLSRLFFTACKTRRRDKLFGQFPDALAMIVRAVRVGVPVTDSIRAVGRELAAPTGPEFARLSDELAIGTLLEDALRAMAHRNDLQEYRFFATALSLQGRTGGALSETLENLADMIRKRVAVRQKGQALSAEAKMSSAVLASLPPLLGLALWLINGPYITLLFTDPLGQKILAAAILSLAFAVASMKYLIHKSLS